jgi:hypothetical protein
MFFSFVNSSRNYIFLFKFIMRRAVRARQQWRFRRAGMAIVLYAFSKCLAGKRGRGCSSSCFAQRQAKMRMR